MKKLGAFVLLLLTSVVAVRPQAHAEGLRVSVPYDFVVAGKLLRAGIYTINRLSLSDWTFLIRSSDPKGTSAFVSFTSFDRVGTNEAKVTFQQTSDLYVLSTIQTQDGVYKLAERLPEVRTASKQHSESSAGR